MRLNLRLRSGRISHIITKSSPKWQFPLKIMCVLSPKTLPDYHLVRTAIPHINQPRRFPPQSSQLLASFASNLSNPESFLSNGR